MQSRKHTALEHLAEGAVVTGVVKNLTEYGAFVDLGGIDGLLHVSDMSHGRVTHPSEVVHAGQAVPFAVVRTADDAVIGSTRFFDLGYWPRPDGHSRHGPDTCEIGYTWLGRDAIRTGANTEMKRLMLTHAFEVWQVRSVCLHTDARNQRSRDAMQRIGARFEGILRAHRLGADLNPRDSVRFSITAAEWPSVRLRLDELARRYQPA